MNLPFQNGQLHGGCWQMSCRKSCELDVRNYQLHQSFSLNDMHSWNLPGGSIWMQKESLINGVNSSIHFTYFLYNYEWKVYATDWATDSERRRATNQEVNAAVPPINTIWMIAWYGGVFDITCGWVRKTSERYNERVSTALKYPKIAKVIAVSTDVWRKKGELDSSASFWTGAIARNKMSVTMRIQKMSD